MRLRRTWVATFNGATCRVYAYEGAPRALEEVPDGAMKGAHKPEHSDRPTRVYGSMGDRRSTSGAETDAEHALEADFVGDVARFLGDAAAAERFDDLVVSASPRALGAFRACASRHLTERIRREIDSDFVNSGAEPILAALQAA